jgi:Leucine-rich repeat (LRR) protein
MNKTILISIIVIILVIAGYLLWAWNPPQNPANNQNISGNQQTQNNKLDLSGQGLTSIPSYVFNETNLEELNVSNNSLTGAIQSQVGQLKNLKVLNASNNQMTGVPAEVGQLTKLEVLDLSNNKLTGLPNELGNLKNLKTLNLSGNNYSQQDLNVILRGLSPTVNVVTGSN